MNAKNVLNKILTLLTQDEVQLTYAKLADGTIVESPTFDVGEDLFVVSEDGTKSPAPNGTHDLMLKDESGNENLIKVRTEDGKIVERENVELELADEKVQPIPQASGEEEKVNERPEQPNSVTSGTLKMAEETEEVMPIPEDENKSEEEAPEIEISLKKMMEDMAYRIEEMEKKMMKMEEAMMPPTASEVVQEEEGIKMAEVEEELPKLDGAPVEEGVKFSAIEDNKKVYGKRTKDAQSNFLSKLYK